MVYIDSIKVDQGDTYLRLRKSTPDMHAFHPDTALPISSFPGVDPLDKKSRLKAWPFRI